MATTRSTAAVVRLPFQSKSQRQHGSASSAQASLFMLLWRKTKVALWALLTTCSIVVLRVFTTCATYRICLRRSSIAGVASAGFSSKRSMQQPAPLRAVASIGQRKQQMRLGERCTKRSQSTRASLSIRMNSEHREQRPNPLQGLPVPSSTGRGGRWMYSLGKRYSVLVFGIGFRVSRRLSKRRTENRLPLYRRPCCGSSRPVRSTSPRAQIRTARRGSIPITGLPGAPQGVSRACPPPV
jgi:hypothetical protein